MKSELIKTYTDSIKELCPDISDEALCYYSEKPEIIELKPRDFYIQAGSTQKNIGYVFTGLLRAFYIDDNGEEKTVNFIKEREYATHYATLEAFKPSKFFFQSIEPTVIINIPFDHIQMCCLKYPEVEKYRRLIITQANVRLLKRMEGLLFDSAQVRYLKFTNENPNLFNRISITDLCTYLGVKRQTLTRIRKKLLNN